MSVMTKPGAGPADSGPMTEEDVSAVEALSPAGVIADAVGCLQNTLSTHLAILSRAGLVKGVRDGRSILYSADLEGMRGLVGYLLTDCCNGRPEVCAPIFETLQGSCGCGPRPSDREKNDGCD
ncbi:MAG: ArsR family transcriptional regulator [Leifsonia xyli]|nr:MAG: ArsR family transcriptional regulator [Leifsonia xyli]